MGPLIDARYKIQERHQDYKAKAKDIMTKQEIGGTSFSGSLLEELKDRHSQSILTYEEKYNSFCYSIAIK